MVEPARGEADLILIAPCTELPKDRRRIGTGAKVDRLDDRDGKAEGRRVGRDE